MGKIDFTNIIIDDFSTAKRDLSRTYTHVLTHIHTDHLKGLNESWNYGPIYCSEVTSKLLLGRFPSLRCLKPIQLNTPTVLQMSATLSLTLTLLDANHCMGSTMVLLQGYLGTILYTGDIRFNQQVFSAHHALYPPHLANPTFTACSIPIDVLYLDNTFLKPKFNFPPQSEVLETAISFVQREIEASQHSRIFVGLDLYGKEEVLVALAKHFDTYIVVDDRRYDRLKSAGLDLELFTTNPEEGFLQIVDKPALKTHLERDRMSVGLVLSGWVNSPAWKYNARIYCVPYSLHSNYYELHAFVASIRPSYLFPIVQNYPEEERMPFAEVSPGPRTDNYYAELQELRAAYCSPPSASYSQLMADSELQRQIMRQLEPAKPLSFSSELTLQPCNMQSMERKKYKLGNSRNEEEISRLRQQLLTKRAALSEPVTNQPREQQKNAQVVDLDTEEVVEVDPFSITFHKFTPHHPRQDRRPQKPTQQTQRTNWHPPTLKSRRSRDSHTKRVDVRELQKIVILQAESQVLSWLHHHPEPTAKLIRPNRPASTG